MSETRNGYRQSFGGLIGAMIAVLAVIAFVWALSWFQHRPTPNPAPTVDYSAALTAARQEAPFHVVAPQPALSGWRATSVDYTGTGHHVDWHLGFVTTGGQYVGLEQGNAPASEFVKRNTTATRAAGQVTVDGMRWDRLKSGGQERALVRRSADATVVVTGTATWPQLVEFAGRLR